MLTNTMAPARKRADVERQRRRRPFHYRPPDAGTEPQPATAALVPADELGAGDGRSGRAWRRSEEARGGAAVAAATGRPRGEADAEMKEGGERERSSGAGGEGAGKEKERMTRRLGHSAVLHRAAPASCWQLTLGAEDGRLG